MTAALLQVDRQTKTRPAILERLNDWQYLERSKELARIEQDKLAPRGAGVPTWEHYQDLLARIRACCPLTNLGSVPARSPKPM